jgi:hypothetical protein
MSDEATTFEEAKRCPKCDKPGEDTGSKPTTKRGVKVHVIKCQTPLCSWYETTWLVQVNEDGSIPKAYEQLGDKQFPLASPETETRVQEAIDAQLRAETKPGSEIRNPRG